MKTLLVLICSLALAFAASGAQEKKKEQKPSPKKPVQAAQRADQRGGLKPGAAKAGGQRQQTNVSQQQNRQAKRSAAAEKAKANVAGAKSKPIKPKHFNVPGKPNTAKAPPVKFRQNRRIEGSQNWKGEKYAVFRNYKSEWRDRDWWHRHHNRIVFVFGAPYYWNAGYWFPAWGYHPNPYYAWDGPIYAYNNLPPDQVIANVQASLQEQGYYQGEVDGLIGPLTRGALADYQRHHGLYVTSAIDQPTLQSLGMA
jgi:Putative peptidoglycan binding domain